MKKQLLTFLALAFSTVSFAQKVDTALFKGVTKIVISNTLSAQENFKLAGQTMIDQGYNIGSKDSEFFQISSEPIKVNGNGAVYMMSIYAVAKDHLLIITGKSKSLSSFKSSKFINNETAFDIVTYENKLISKNIFQKLKTYTSALGSSKVTFSE
jgi:hypothetical protein